MDRFSGLPRAALLGLSVPVATTHRARTLGLAFLDAGEAGEGLLIPGCRSVHTFGMRFQLDLIFLNAAGRVVALRRQLPPRRFARCSAARAVLELPSPPFAGWGHGS